MQCWTCKMFYDHENKCVFMHVCQPSSYNIFLVFIFKQRQEIALLPLSYYNVFLWFSGLVFTFIYNYYTVLCNVYLCFIVLFKCNTNKVNLHFSF